MLLAVSPTWPEVAMLAIVVVGQVLFAWVLSRNV